MRILLIFTVFFSSLSLMAEESNIVKTAYGKSLIVESPNTTSEVFRIDNKYWSGTVINLKVEFEGIPNDKDKLIITDSSEIQVIVPVGKEFEIPVLNPPVTFVIESDAHYESRASLWWDYKVTELNKDKLPKEIPIKLTDEQLQKIEQLNSRGSAELSSRDGVKVGEILSLYDFPFAKIKVDTEVVFYDNFEHGNCLSVSIGHNNEGHLFNVAETKKSLPDPESNDNQFSFPLKIKAASLCEYKYIIKRKEEPKNDKVDILIKLNNYELYYE